MKYRENFGLSGRNAPHLLVKTKIYVMELGKKKRKRKTKYD